MKRRLSIFLRALILSFLRFSVAVSWKRRARASVTIKLRSVCFLKRRYAASKLSSERRIIPGIHITYFLLKFGREVYHRIYKSTLQPTGPLHYNLLEHSRRKQKNSPSVLLLVVCFLLLCPRQNQANVKFYTRAVKITVK